MSDTKSSKSDRGEKDTELCVSLESSVSNDTVALEGKTESYFCGIYLVTERIGIRRGPFGPPPWSFQLYPLDVRSDQIDTLG